MCNEAAAAAAATVLEKRQRRPCLLSSLRRSEPPPATRVGADPRLASGGPGAWGWGPGGGGGGVAAGSGLRGGAGGSPRPRPLRTSDFPKRTVKTAGGCEGVCVCARAGGQARGTRGARRGPRGASGIAAGGRLLPRGLRSARPNLASRQLARRRPAAHLEGGAGARRRPSACPPAAHKAEPAEKERPEPDAPPAPRPRRSVRHPHPSISPARQLTSAKGAAAAPGESEANFGAASPARSSVPGSLPGSRSPGRATPPLPTTAPAPGPAGRTGLLPAAPGKGGRGGGASLHGLSPDAAAPGPGPAARTGPQGGSESAKCLVGARGGRRGRGGGCRGSARLGRRGAARAMLRMFGMRTGMK